MKTFKPMLINNEQPDLDTLSYPLLSSTKLDGCRMLSYKGKLLTRSLKPVQNKQLNDKFEPLRAYTENEITLLDGEIFAEGIPFYMISSCFMTQDYTTKKSIQRWRELCETYEVDITREEVLDKLKFYMFDCVVQDGYNAEFIFRNGRVIDTAKEFPDLIVPVKQIPVNSANEVKYHYESVLNDGYEGLILKDPNGRYKCGRTTIKENLAFKVKPYVSIDAKITGVKQATKVDPNASKTVNELGWSVTSKLKEDRIPIARAKTFTVNYEIKCPHCDEGLVEYGLPIDHGYSVESCENCNGSGKIRHKVDVGIGMTEAERDEIWANQESYIGRWIEYKGLLVGSKDVPRHCNMIRFREDKDEI